MLIRTFLCRTVAAALPFLVLAWIAGGGTACAQSISQMRLAPTDGNLFGTALASAGSTLMVGDAYWRSPSGSVPGAAYPYTQAASGGWTEGAELTAGDGQSYDLFGSSVAMAGTVAAVGAPFHNGCGGVYVFTQGKTGWSQTQEIVPADGAPGDFFGSAVALTKTALAIGAFRKSGGAGVVYLYALKAGQWALQSRLAAPSGSAAFGYSLSLSGTSLLIGAPGANSAVGAAYVYTLSGVKWTQQAQLIPADGQSDGQFGYAVALSNTLAVIGSPGTSAAYAYKSIGSGTAVKWTLQAELYPFEGQSIAGFGAALALSSTTLVVSALNTDDRETYVFSLQKTGWVPVAEPTPVDDVFNEGGFGTAVALVGNTVAVSRPYVPNRSASGSQTLGAVYSYTLGPEALLPNGGPGDYYGYAVAVSGATVLSGAPGKNNGVGTVTAYTLSGASLTHATVLKAANGQPGDGYGAALAFDGSTLFVAAPNVASGQGALYVYGYKAGVWTFQAELTATDGQPGDLFGDALALSGSTLVVGAPGKNGGTGAAYVLVLHAGVWSQQAELTASDGEIGDGFGSAVGIDGNTLVVGSPNATTPITFYAGDAYVFVQSTGQWTQTTELSALDGQFGDGFGTAVAVSGVQIAVGAPGSGSGTGAVYLYVGNASGWALGTELAEGADSGFGDEFGSALVLSGGTLIVGAPGHEDSTGLVCVYTQAQSGWTQRQWLTAADGQPSDAFGTAIAFSGGSMVGGAANANFGVGSLYAF